MFENSSNVLADSFTNLWTGVIGFLPQIVIALVIFIVGWIVASLVGRIIEQVFKAIKVDEALRKTGIDDTFSKAGIVLNTGKFVGGLVKWFVIVVFLMASFDVLKLTQVNEFLKSVVIGYIPRVVVAVLMLLVAAVIAEALKKIIITSTKAAGLTSANLLGNIAKWIIWVFAILVSLVQLGIGEPIINTLFTGVVVAFSIAFGLAFGLGGQSAAGEAISKIKSEISERRG